MASPSVLTPGLAAKVQARLAIKRAFASAVMRAATSEWHSARWMLQQRWPSRWAR
jgi:hypothetical protein